MMDRYWSYGYGFGGFGMLVGWIVMIAFWIFVVWAIVSFIRWIMGQNSGARCDPATQERAGIMSDMKRSVATNILEERYARGEVSKEEFEEKKKDLRR